MVTISISDLCDSPDRPASILVKPAERYTQTPSATNSVSPSTAGTGWSVPMSTSSSADTSSSFTSNDSFSKYGSPSSSCVSSYPKIRFAPLPSSGRQRSNSITIGVAARAQMLQSQGSSTNANGWSSNGNMGRYYGGQPVQNQNVWYTTGQLPPDIYTYKDAVRSVKAVCGRIRRKKSTDSQASQESLASGIPKDPSPPASSPAFSTISLQSVGEEGAESEDSHSESSEASTPPDFMPSEFLKSDPLDGAETPTTSTPRNLSFSNLTQFHEEPNRLYRHVSDKCSVNPQWESRVDG